MRVKCPGCGKAGSIGDNVKNATCPACNVAFDPATGTVIQSASPPPASDPVPPTPAPTPAPTPRSPRKPVDWLVRPRVWRFGVRGLLAISIPLQLILGILSLLVFGIGVFSLLLLGAMLAVCALILVSLVVAAGRGRDAPIQWRALKWTSAFGGCFFAWAVTSWSPSAWVIVNYVALLGASGCLVVLARMRWPAHARRASWGAAAVGLGIIVFLGWFDRYDERWTNDRGIHYTDTHGRFSSRWRCRRIIGGPNSYFRSMHGPMTESGRTHGQWTYWSKDSSGPNLGFSETWYWYGEKITEGEWHLRNK